MSGDDLIAAGYVSDQSGYWWSPGDVTTFYGPDQPSMFRLPYRRESYPLHNATPGPYGLVTGGYDAPYQLIQTARASHADDTAAVAVTGVADYQAAAVWQLTDGNGVVSQALYDPLGAVLASSVFKPASGQQPRTGDMDLRDYQVHADATFASVFADKQRYLQGAAAFYFYDRNAWTERGSPAGTVSITATRYVSDMPGQPRRVQTVTGYPDGAGLLAGSYQEAEPADGAAEDRWIVSGRTSYTSRGQPVQEYLPYYTATPDFGPPPSAPPPRVMNYDPLGRVVQVNEPKGYFTSTVYTPWQRQYYDEDDTVLDSPYYQQFMASYPANPTPAQQAEKAALDKAASFYGTPGISVFDNVSHPVRDITNSLGNITPDTLATIVAGSGISPADLWDELHTKGYLVTTPLPAPHTGLTALFEPYTPGFTLQLDPPYDQFAAATTDLLAQACLTSLAGYDQDARLVTAIDPRLYYTDVRTGTGYTSMRYAYPMGQPQVARSLSADAGPLLVLADILGRGVSAWDGRGLRQDRTFDGLGRPLVMTVTDTGGTTRTLEVVTYGEHQPDPAAANLIGRAYQVRDEAGVLLTPGYTISGLPGTAVRQFPSDYSTEPDWSGEVPLDPQQYTTTLRYDALRRPIERGTPDGATLTIGYHVSGRLATLAGAQGGQPASYLAGASYNAAGQRLRSSYGNGAQQVSVYDDATARLSSLATDLPGGGQVQRADYFYDPVGNVTLTRDQTAKLAFSTPQPEAACDYTYDASYRVLRTTGLQHRGIDATTYATGFKQTLFAPLAATDLDAETLEPYAESYSYDAASNLVATEHTAASVSFPRTAPVEPGSNHLAGVGYDGAGNQLSVELTAPVTLSWDARGNLTATSPVPRDDGETEQTWFSYDRTGERARKVVERRDAAGQLISTTDIRYLGPYLDRRAGTPQVPAGIPAGSVLRVEDGTRPVAVVDTTAEQRETRYQLGDLLGSVGVELAQDATVLSYEGFFPQGGSSVIAAADQAAAMPKALRYSGDEADDSTGLYYYGGRYLAPWLGRWLTTDPAGPAADLNLYAFVRGNPVTLIDVGGFGEDDPNVPAGQPQGGTPVTPPVTPATDPAQIPNQAPGQGQPPGQPPAQPVNQPVVVHRPIHITPRMPTYDEVSQFVIDTGKYTIYSLLNAPQHTLIYGPTALARKYLGTPEEGRRQRASQAARREELRLIAWSLMTGMGYNPGSRQSLEWLLKPRTSPWTAQDIELQDPRTQQIERLGTPLQGSINTVIRDPGFYASYAGGFLGSFLTVGIMFAFTSRYAIFLGLSRGLARAIPWTAGALGIIGRGEDKDRQWAKYEKLRNTLSGDDRALALRIEQEVGIPRTLLYGVHLRQKTAGYRDDAVSGVLIGLVSVSIYGYLWFVKKPPWPWRSPTKPNQLMLHPIEVAKERYRQILFPKNRYDPTVKKWYIDDPKNNRTYIYDPVNKSVRVVDTTRTALTPYVPKSKALTVPVKKPTAVMVRPQPPLPAVWTPAPLPAVRTPAPLPALPQVNLPTMLPTRTLVRAAGRTYAGAIFVGVGVGIYAGYKFLTSNKNDKNAK